MGTPHLVAGQVAEFLLWAELTARSEGRLHVFLPLWDRGIDAMVHRRADGAFLPLQVKSRSRLHEGFAHYIVPAHSLRDDRALLVFVYVDGDRLGPRLAIVTEGQFKAMVRQTVAGGLPVYQAAIDFNTKGGSRWAPCIHGLDQLEGALGVAAAQATAPGPFGWGASAPAVGALGEAEVIRQLAAEPRHNIFRPFPDLETAEILVRHTETFRVLGLQVKTVRLDRVHETTVDIQAASFRASADTRVVVLAWMVEEARFHQQCLLIPSMEVAFMASLHGAHFEFAWTPGGNQSRSRLAGYRQDREQLGRQVAGLLTAP